MTSNTHCFLALMFVIVIIISENCLTANTTTTATSGTLEPSSDAVMSQSTVEPSSDAVMSHSTVEPSSDAVMSQSTVEPSSEAVMSQSTVEPSSDAVMSQSTVESSLDAVMNQSTVEPSLDAVMSQSTVEPSSEGKPPWRGPRADHVMNQGTVSKEQYEMLRLIVELILKPTVCITGLVLNIIGIYVLLKPTLRHGFYIYLAVLSLADVGYLFFGLLRSSVKIYALFDNEAAVNIQSTIIPYTDRYLEICLCKLGAYCIMFFSLDRLMAIVRPLHARDNFLSLHSRGICMSLTLFIFIVYIPKILNMEIAIVKDPNTNLSVAAVKHVRYEDGSPMKTLMKYGIAIDVLFTYLPPVFVIAANIGIVIQIQRLRRIRKQMFSKDCMQKVKNIDQQKLIITVVIISAFFLGVYIPMIIIRNLTVNNPDYRPFHREHYMGQVIPIFVSFGWSINAAIDFTVYLGTSAKFRQILKTTCCCGIATSGRKRNSSSSQSYPGSGKSQTTGTEGSWCSEGRQTDAGTTVRSTNGGLIVTKTHPGSDEDDVVRGIHYIVDEEFPSLHGSTTSMSSRQALVVDADKVMFKS